MTAQRAATLTLVVGRICIAVGASPAVGVHKGETGRRDASPVPNWPDRFVQLVNDERNTSGATAGPAYLQSVVRFFYAAFRGELAASQSCPAVETLSIDEAYAVQRSVIAERIASGEEIAGYKVGCTSRAIRTQFGLTEPVVGRLMHPRVHRGDSLKLRTLDYSSPAVEPEFVFMIAKDVTTCLSEDEPLKGIVASVSPGIEVHNYQWLRGRPTPQELIASNGLHAGLIVGDQKCGIDEHDLNATAVALFKNEQKVASGAGAEIMGGPLKSLRWLINHLVTRGQGLRAGQLVIPGSPVELIPVAAGDRIAACLENIGSVEATFGSA